MKTFTVVYTCFLLLIGFGSVQAQKPSDYTIANKIPLEGDGGWDYLTVDEATDRLFISHGTMVQVLDTKALKLVGTIPNTNGVHGITIATDLNKGFISCGKDSSVVVFNVQTLNVVNTIAVTGRNPDAIQYDPFTKRVFTFNGGSANATVIDAVTEKVIGAVKFDGKPEFSATDGKGRIYVNIEDKSTVNVINTTTLAIEHKWSVAPGEEPSGLAIDNESHHLFVVCHNKLLVVVDAQTGRVISTHPIGSGVDGVSFDAGKKRVYASNGEGTVTVVQRDGAGKYSVVENVATQRGARTIAVNTKTHRLYLPTAEYAPAPPPTAANPKPRPTVKPGTFTILEIAPKQ